MACTWLTRMARSCGSARMLRSSLAPSVRWPERSARRSKNLGSRGSRRIWAVHSRLLTCPEWPSEEQSNISRLRGKRQTVGELAGQSAVEESRRAARRLEANDEEHDKNRNRSHRHCLQKAKKALTEAHRCIMSAARSKGDVTSRVDLTSDQRNQRRKRCGEWELSAEAPA